MSGYIGTQPVPQATQNRESFTATSSQTSFATIGYTPQFLDVYLNGVKLVDGTDFTATNGSDVVLTTGAASGDVLEVVSYSTYEVNSQNYTGGLTVDNDGATVLTVDRATSDGTIIDVQKNGTTVGSIGVVASDRLYIATDDSADSGLAFDGDNSRIYACTSSGASSDNTTDLGSGTQRFKDLYLSGGVYLGGTGAANKLDDYEEGTWTAGCTVGSCAGGNTTYTKVGDLVTVTGRVNTFSNIGVASQVSITGIPFSISGDWSGSMFAKELNQVTECSVYASGTSLKFYGVYSSGYDPLLHTDLKAGAEIYFSVTYKTTQ